MRPLHPILSLLIPILAGCATHRSGPQVTVRPLPPHVPPRPELRYPEQIRSYHLGRHVDPARPGLLHETHPIHRIEAEAAWNLHPALGPAIPVSPAHPAPDPAFAPPPLDDAIIAELNRQQDATERVMWEATQLAGSYDQLQSVIADMTRVAAEFPSLRQQLLQTSTEVRRIQGVLDTITRSDPPPHPGPNPNPIPTSIPSSNPTHSWQPVQPDSQP